MARPDRVFPFSLAASERKIEYEILRRGQREKAFEFYVGIVHDFRMGHSNRFKRIQQSSSSRSTMPQPQALATEHHASK